MYLGAYWKYRSCTLGEYIALLRRFLQELRGYSPLFAELSDAGSKPNDEVRINDDLSNLSQIAIERAGYKPRNIIKFNDLGQEIPLLDRVSDIGYGLTLVNGKKEGDGKILVSARCGTNNQWTSDAVVINFYDDAIPQTRDYKFWLELLSIVVRVWNPEASFVMDYKFDKESQDKGDNFSIGWINYFTGDTYKQVNDDRIPFVPFGNGAVVMLSQTPVSADDPAAVAAAHHVRDVLRQHGMMNWRKPS